MTSILEAALTKVQRREISEQLKAVTGLNPALAMDAPLSDGANLGADDYPGNAFGNGYLSGYRIAAGRLGTQFINYGHFELANTVPVSLGAVPHGANPVTDLEDILGQFEKTILANIGTLEGESYEPGKLHGEAVGAAAWLIGMGDAVIKYLKRDDGFEAAFNKSTWARDRDPTKKMNELRQSYIGFAKKVYDMAGIGSTNYARTQLR